jgi:hypothetical protein
MDEQEKNSPATGSQDATFFFKDVSGLDGNNVSSTNGIPPLEKGEVAQEISHIPVIQTIADRRPEPSVDSHQAAASPATITSFWKWIIVLIVLLVLVTNWSHFVLLSRSVKHLLRRSGREPNRYEEVILTALASMPLGYLVLLPLAVHIHIKERRSKSKRQWPGGPLPNSV